MTRIFMNVRLIKLLVLTVCVLASCEDKPVMSLPRVEDLAGNWECKELPKRTQAAIGMASKLGPLVLERGGRYSVTKFPLSDPLRLADRKGQWSLLDPTMTPSGACSVELDGVFLSIYRRGNKFILRYPIDVIEGYSSEYTKMNPQAN